MCKSVKV